MRDIIQLKMSLIGSDPVIWRRVLVEKELTFYGLHCVIQQLMGWDDDHMYDFVIDGKRMGDGDDIDFLSMMDLFKSNNEVEEELDEDEEDEEGELDEEDDNPLHQTLEEVLTKVNKKFKYEYDYGDNWEISIQVEKYLDYDKKIEYPRCIDGALNGPPEDCGGIWNYNSIVEALENKKHPDHDDISDLFGYYDPNYFNMLELNNILINGYEIDDDEEDEEDLEEVEEQENPIIQIVENKKPKKR